MPSYEISVIPTDMLWQPDETAAAEATARVRQLYAGPGESVEEVFHRYSDRIMAVQPGLNLSRIGCPLCPSEVPLRWYYDLLAQHAELFDHLDVTVPCCGGATSLDALVYDWPVGYARFKVVAYNPTRADELTAEEMAIAAAVLGHPLRQVFCIF